MVTYKLHLIRHGMTAGNRDGRYVGRTDLPICPEGRAELQRLVAQYEYPAAQEIYCSPLLRCRETAELIYPDHPLTVVDGLVELSMGDFEGKRLTELKDKPEYRAWLADSMHNTPPGSLESGEGFAKRIAQALNSIFMNMSQNRISQAAVITHGGVIMGLLSAFAMPRLPLSRWAVSNGTGYTVSMSAQLWMRDNVIELISAVPEGFTPGADPRVMDSLGVSADD
ncbi:MAG: histidine phosphatase family protein [Oscillospiraceae bacterium]